MGMLDRFKKGNAIVDLIKLIEDSGEPKKTQLMTMVRAEDPAFAAAVEARVLTWEKIRGLPEGIFAEIVSATPPKFIAMAIGSEDPAFVVMIEKCLGKAYNDYKQEKDAFKTSPPTPAQVEVARRKMVSEARKLDTEGRIKIAPEAVGEVTRGVTSAVSPSTGTSPQTQAPVSQVIYENPGNAKADEPCPPFATFNAELPPPGLSGERLETYLKSMLGS